MNEQGKWMLRGLSLIGLIATLGSSLSNTDKGIMTVALLLEPTFAIISLLRKGAT